MPQANTNVATQPAPAGRNVTLTLDALLGARLDAAFAQKRSELSATPEDRAAPPPRMFVKPSKSLYKSTLAVTTEWTNHEVGKIESTPRIMSLVEILSNPMANQAYKALSSGAEIIRQMRIDTNGFVKKPTDFQREMIEFVTQLLGRRIYGMDWKINQMDIRRRLGWKEETHGIGGIMTGRKEGKSTGLSMAASLAMLNIPGVEVALFSKTRAQAQIILNMAKTAIGSHLRRNEFKIEVSASCMKLTLLSDRNDVRVCTAYSGNADVSTIFFCYLFCCFFLVRINKEGAPPAHTHQPNAR